MNLDQIARVASGDPLSAERDGQILDALKRQTMGPHVVGDSLGTYHMPFAKRRICRFEMTAALELPQSGSGYADAYPLYWVEGEAFDNLTPDETGDPIRVVDSMRKHSKMATASGDVGAYGLAWIPDDPMVHSPYKASFEVLCMQTPGMFTGSLDSALDTADASVMVTAFRTEDGPSGENSGHITWEGYDPFGPGWAAANDGLKIEVYNLPGGGVPYIFESDSGNTVVCRWNMRESKYYMLQAECPLDDQEAALSGWFYDP